MEGYTDIHCHIIPCVDDGAKNLEYAVRMLRIAYWEGFRNIILTPHYHGGRMEADIDKINHSLQIFKEEVDKFDYLPTMNLYTGSEIFYFPTVCEWLDQKKLLTLAGSDYVLLEFGYTCDFRTIKDAITNVRNNGYFPIIAHAERYSCLVSSKKDIDELISRGAYIQVNARAFAGDFKTKSFVKSLLKNDQLHFIATDSHDPVDRSPSIKSAVEYIRKHYNEDYLNHLLIDNPSCILNNKFITN